MCWTFSFIACWVGGQYIDVVIVSSPSLWWSAGGRVWRRIAAGYGRRRVTHLVLSILRFRGYLEMDLFRRSLEVTRAPLLETLYTVPLVELYRPRVRKITWSPMWMSLCSASKAWGSVGGPRRSGRGAWSSSSLVSLCMVC